MKVSSDNENSYLVLAALMAALRPNIPEYSQISENILQAIDQVYNDTKEADEALNEAAAKSAKSLGW